VDDRFDRHRLIPGWDQERLAAATLIIVGVGALGNEVARLLALCGVGRVVLCDPDRVAASNLSRASLFLEGDVGRPKVEVAAEALRALNPSLSVEARSAPLVHGIGLAELRDAALVLGCLDSRSARLQLAGRCGLVEARSIDGGTHPWGGEVRPYLVPGGACYGCSLTPAERAVADVPWSCLDVADDGPVGAAAPPSAIVGSWMALIATRYLMGLSLPGGTLNIDGSRGTTVIVRQERDPGCPLHQPLGPVSKLTLGASSTVGELRSALDGGGVPLLWEPVQREAECRRCGFREQRWTHQEIASCPRCGASLHPHTTLELDQAPAERTLASVGVAPREILAVRAAREMRWVELAA
jgi:molybdopterin/thiamine biosynthesis adenylyltransferase